MEHFERPDGDAVLPIGGRTVKKITSISLGSSVRDHRAEITLEGETYQLERIGTNGDMEVARRKFEELDGKVDVLSMGGTDLFFYLGNRRYPVRDAHRMVRNVKKTPVADGSKLKVVLEYGTINKLIAQGILKPEMKVLMISAVDRFGMAQALAESGCSVTYGDFMYSLGMNIPLRRLSTVRFMAMLLLPIIGLLPFSFFYPTGKKQEENKPKFSQYFHWADVVAGDYNYIARYMPKEMTGKTLITNTVTAKDIEALKALGVRTLITTTPEIGGRSFGTNVIEGILVCKTGKRAEDLGEEETRQLLTRFGFEPRIVQLA
ncbi:MAG: quinate 5-dehydrogenase [Chloroflexi bacterium]|nr:quinate 5-dehydrogenase [Chloroflexota bacterium]